MPLIRNQKILNYVYNYSEDKEKLPTLLLIHGLFASETALGVIERHFPQFNSLRVDLPNHGSSYYTLNFDYKEIASAIFEIVEKLNLTNLIVIGHSMGGKVAMTFAHYFADYIKALVVLDMAPVVYGKRGHDGVLKALHHIAEKQIDNRKEALSSLVNDLGDTNLANFFMKSFTTEEPHRFVFNLPLIESDYISLSSWNQVKVSLPTLFIRGGKSDYVNEERQQLIDAQFSNYQLVTIPQATHWIHIDGAPDIFEILTKFFKDHGCL